MPAVVTALGGKPGDDVMPLIEANIAMIVHTGENTWLEALGIVPGFWSYP